MTVLKKLFVIVIVLLLTSFINADNMPVVKVKVSKAKIRVGNATYDHVIAVLEKGVTLSVIRKKGNWFQVRIPDTVNCYVSARYIKGSGNSGIVNANVLNVRITPNVIHIPVGQVRKNQHVTIRGRKDDYFVIAPPTGASAWINESLVEELKGRPVKAVIKTSTNRETIKETKEKKKNTHVSVPREKTPRVKRTTVHKTATRREVPEKREKITEETCWELQEKVITILNQQKYKKLEDRYYQRAIDALKIITDNTSSSSLSSWANKKLIAVLKLSAMSKGARAAIESEQKRKAVEKQAEQVEKARLEAIERKHAEKIKVNWTEKGYFYHVGKVWNRPAKYKVRSHGKVICYLQSSTLDLSKHCYYKKKIGFIGNVVRIDPESGLKVYEVVKIEVLEE